LKEIGFSVEERALGIDEIMDAYRSGQLKEAFGTGTAATISYIKELRYKDFVMEFRTESWEAAPEVKRRLDAIREGKVEDRFGWMYPVR
jgi:branched-chain amino acid aminotransferase